MFVADAYSFRGRFLTEAKIVSQFAQSLTQLLLLAFKGPDERFVLANFRSSVISRRRRFGLHSRQ